MDTRDVPKYRESLESTLLGAIKTFEEQTGVIVESIDIDRAYRPTTTIRADARAFPDLIALFVNCVLP